MKKLYLSGLFAVFMLCTPFVAVAQTEGSLCDYTDQGTQDGVWQNGHCVSNGTYNTGGSTVTTGGATKKDGFVPLAPIPGLTDETTVGSVVKSTDLANFFNNLYKYLIGVAATIAVIEIIWGGILYSTTDSVGNKDEGKEKIRMAIFGLILVLSPVLVFTIINPSILNLSLNLQPIKTLSTPASTIPDAVAPKTVTNAATGQTTVIFNEGWYTKAVPGAFCFTTPPNSGGNYYCASDMTKCTIASNGASSVVTSCTAY